MKQSLSLWQRLSRTSSPLALKQTFTYYAAFIALGLTTASVGPTLLGLANQTGSALSEISYLFTARSGGYLLGSFIGGRLFDRLPAHRTMAGAFVAIAIALASVPFVPLLGVLIAVWLVIGWMEAVVDVGSNALIVWVHREHVAPFMNGLHFFFAIGGFLSPLLIAYIISSFGSYTWSYFVLAVLTLPMAFLLWGLPNPSPIVAHTEHASVRPNTLLLILLIAIFVMIAAAEVSFSGWISTYTVKVGLADTAGAALVTAAFWGAFMFSRLASIPLATRMRPRTIIITDLLLALVGVAVIYFLPASYLALWLGTILFGLGIASSFPTVLTFAGRHMTITGAVTGWFFVGASIGSMVLPWFIGQLFERVGAVIVLWVIGGTLLLGLGVFGMILVFLRQHETK